MSQSACEVSFRIASWAVVKGDTQSFQGEILAKGPLPGILQSAYRAEVYAVLQALQLGRQHRSRVSLWTDCNAVVMRLRRLMRGQTPRPNSPHADLWREIFTCLQEFPEGCLQVTKVVAHQSLADATGPLEERCCLHNQIADKAAVAAQSDRPASFWEFYAKHVHATHASRELSRSVQNVLLSISQAVVRDDDGDGVEERADLCEQPAFPDRASQQLPALTIPAAAVRWYGDDVVRSLLSWYWFNLYDSPHPMVWMSHYQLYVDYMLSGAFGPVKMTRWCACSDEPAFDILAVPFQTRTRWFARVLKESLRHQGAGFSYQYCRPTSRSLHLHTGCLAVRWDPIRLAAVDDWILAKCPQGVWRTTQALASLPSAKYDAKFPPVFLTIS